MKSTYCDKNRYLTQFNQRGIMQKSKPIITLLFLFITSAVMAEDMSFLLTTTPSQRAESQTRFMKNKLGLSDEITSKIQAINIEYAEKIDPILKGSSLGIIKKHDVEKIQEQKDNALQSILTPQQFDVYNKSKDELTETLRKDLSH